MYDLTPAIEPAPLPQQRSPLRTLASIVSYVFHPVFMPPVMAVVLYFLYPVPFQSLTPQALEYGFASLVLSTVFFPLFTMLLLKALGFLKTYQMRQSRDRVIPLIATMIFYFWAYEAASYPHTLNGHEVAIPAIIRILLLGAYWGIIVVFLVSIFFKISMHTAAAGGVVGIMIVLMAMSPVKLLVPLFATMMLAGMVGTARLVLREHTQAEVWMGYAAGLLCMLGAWWYV